MRDNKHGGCSVVLLALAVSAWCACEEPRLDVRLSIPDEYSAGVTQTSLIVLRPSAESPFDCDDLAMGEVAQEVLRASQVQEIRAEGGSTAALAGIDRLGLKLLYARGFNEDQQVVVAACDEVREIVGATAVELVAEPMKTLTTESGSSAGNGAKLLVTVRDVLGKGLGEVVVAWRSTGADGLEVEGSVQSDLEGKAAVSPPSPEFAGPMVLELVSRWQVSPVVLPGFRPLRDRRVFELRSFSPGDDSFGNPRLTWSLVRLGRLGPVGEVGLAALVDPAFKLGSACGTDWEDCETGCGTDSDSQDCRDLCLDELWKCSTPYVETRRLPDTNSELRTSKISLGVPGRETGAADWILRLVPGEIRDRVFALPLGSATAWYELDSSGQLLLRHQYSPPQGGARVEEYLVLPPCAGAFERPLLLLRFEDGVALVYEPEGGEPLLEHPMSKLDSIDFGEDATDRWDSLAAAGCIGEVGGDKEHLAVLLGSEAHGGQGIAVESDGALLVFDWSRPVSVFGSAKRRSELEPASLLIGQMGVGTAEVIRVRLKAADRVSESTLEVSASDSVLAMPVVLSAGEIDGRVVRGEESDIAALVSLSNSTSGKTDHFAQVISGHSFDGKRLVGLLRVVSEDDSSLVPHMVFLDANADGIDDIVVLHRFAATGVTAKLTIYAMGK